MFRSTIQDETTKVQEYFETMAQNDDLQIECLRQQKPSEEKEEEQRPSADRTQGAKRVKYP